MSKKKEVKVEPKITDFIGKKLNDISREENETKLHFSNGLVLSLKGDVHLWIK